MRDRPLEELMQRVKEICDEMETAGEDVRTGWTLSYKKVVDDLAQGLEEIYKSRKKIDQAKKQIIREFQRISQLQKEEEIVRAYAEILHSFAEQEKILSALEDLIRVAYSVFPACREAMAETLAIAAGVTMRVGREAAEKIKAINVLKLLEQYVAKIYARRLSQYFRNILYSRTQLVIGNSILLAFNVGRSEFARSIMVTKAGLSPIFSFFIMTVASHLAYRLIPSTILRSFSRKSTLAGDLFIGKAKGGKWKRLSRFTIEQKKRDGFPAPSVIGFMFGGLQDRLRRFPRRARRKLTAEARMLAPRIWAMRTLARFANRLLARKYPPRKSIVKLAKKYLGGRLLLGGITRVSKEQYGRIYTELEADGRREVLKILSERLSERVSKAYQSFFSQQGKGWEKGFRTDLYRLKIQKEIRFRLLKELKRVTIPLFLEVGFTRMSPKIEEKWVPSGRRKIKRLADWRTRLFTLHFGRGVKQPARPLTFVTRNDLFDAIQRGAEVVRLAGVEYLRMVSGYSAEDAERSARSFLRILSPQLKQIRWSGTNWIRLRLTEAKLQKRFDASDLFEATRKLHQFLTGELIPAFKGMFSRGG